MTILMSADSQNRFFPNVEHCFLTKITKPYLFTVRHHLSNLNPNPCQPSPPPTTIPKLLIIFAIAFIPGITKSKPKPRLKKKNHLFLSPPLKIKTSSYVEKSSSGTAPSPTAHAQGGVDQ